MPFRESHVAVCRCPLGAEERPQLFAGKKPETTRKQVLPKTGVSVEADLPPRLQVRARDLQHLDSILSRKPSYIMQD